MMELGPKKHYGHDTQDLVTLYLDTCALGCSNV